MQIELENNIFNVFISRKNIKNMYLRIKEDGIHITCNYLVPKSMIMAFIKNNSNAIISETNRINKKEKKKESFYYLGKCYDVIILNTVSKIEFYDNKVFVKNKSYLDTFLKNESKRVFNDRLEFCYNLFEEKIPYPTLMIGKMKRKWGYNNKNKKLIKLNFELIKYSINEIDYVIIHELCHFLEFNHSKNFWKYVKKYKADYKEAQRILKED